MREGTKIGDWRGHASAALSAAGYQRGAARAAVLEVLATQSCALSAAEIEAAAQGTNGRGVSRASVYRILEQLEDLRLVTRVELGDQARFETNRPDGHHHHHMVCADCGNVIPFEDEDLEASIVRLARRSTFTVEEHDITLRGRCGDCAK